MVGPRPAPSPQEKAHFHPGAFRGLPRARYLNLRLHARVAHRARPAVHATGYDPWRTRERPLTSWGSPCMMKHHTNLKRNDDAISPVIGTILMVAATVIIAGAVYAAVNAYNGKSSNPTPDAGFKATTIDTGTTPNGAEDTIKVTYLSGSAGTATVTVKTAAGATAQQGTPPTDCAGALSGPGQFLTCKPGAAGTYYVVVTVGSSTLLDQTMTLKE